MEGGLVFLALWFSLEPPGHGSPFCPAGGAPWGWRLAPACPGTSSLFLPEKNLPVLP